MHLTTCGFTLLPCPNQCQKGEEVRQLLCKDLKKHTQEECPRRQYECPHCKVIEEYEERKITHLEKCPLLRIPCPNPIGVIQLCHNVALHSIANCNANIKRFLASMLILAIKRKCCVRIWKSMNVISTAPLVSH